MAGTKRPLKIVCTDEELRPKLKALLKEGDVIVGIEDVIGADAIVGPRCLMTVAGTENLTANVLESWRKEKPLPPPKAPGEWSECPVPVKKKKKKVGQDSTVDINDLTLDTVEAVLDTLEVTHDTVSHTN